MIGLDCNILVQLAFADHPFNARTVSAVKAEAGGGSQLVIAPLVLTEFLHVVTDAKRFDPPFSMSEALEWRDTFLATPAVRVLLPNHASIHRSFVYLLSPAGL
jgi:predicted nucleic acid-binding protein